MVHVQDYRNYKLPFPPPKCCFGEKIPSFLPDSSTAESHCGTGNTDQRKGGKKGENGEELEWSMQGWFKALIKMYFSLTCNNPYRINKNKSDHSWRFCKIFKNICFKCTYNSSTICWFSTGSSYSLNNSSLICIQVSQENNSIFHKNKARHLLIFKTRQPKIMLRFNTSFVFPSYILIQTVKFWWNI